ncbi:MAG: hypothetical protein BMS9Abin26_0021 [Gammaproteobacteria bacterium]|nr:MAG: hypothetical protein BMS9Abin26_0021 [Gammaproteobacteria bacterium]
MKQLSIILLTTILLSLQNMAMADRGHHWRQQASNYLVADKTSTTRISISLGEAVARVQRQTGGRILSASTIGRNGQAVYRIKVLVGGSEVRVYYVDAASGRMN